MSILYRKTLLPKEIQILIDEYNVQHRSIMKLVMNELLEECSIRNDSHNICENCQDNLYNNNIIEVYIMWKKFSFCSLRCEFETDDYIRKSYRRRKYIY
jgi:hypothetical protein